jgi:hypothetical protein
MVRISVDSKSMAAYGSAAEESFSGIRKELEGLVTSCTTVPYEGPNSASFKTGCGKLAGDFSTALLGDITKFTGAVREVTTGIAQALGGSPVSIQFNGTAITPPTVPAADPNYTMVDTAPLTNLKATINTHFTSINTHLDRHLQAFQQAKWEGNARDAAHTAITTFTGNTKTDVTDANNKITKYIDDQIQSVTVADQA